jgi:hypothetical protein
MMGWGVVLAVVVVILIGCRGGFGFWVVERRNLMRCLYFYFWIGGVARVFDVNVKRIGKGQTDDMNQFGAM